MNPLRYLGRAFTRAKERGVVDMALYSSHVARNHVRDWISDVRFLGARTRTHKVEMDGIIPTMHTPTAVLNALFDAVPISPNDVLVDVGCGEGRVIAYWLSSRLKNRIYGVEINKRAYEFAAERLKHYPNVSVLFGDAANLTPSDATFFYMFNTLPLEPLSRLEKRISEAYGPKRVLIYNYLDEDLSPFMRGDWKVGYLKDETHWRQYRAVLFSRQ